MTVEAGKRMQREGEPSERLVLSCNPTTESSARGPHPASKIKDIPSSWHEDVQEFQHSKPLVRMFKCSSFKSTVGWRIGITEADITHRTLYRTAAAERSATKKKD